MDRTPRYTQVTAPRDPFPPAGSTSSGLAASEYTQTSPTPARGTQYALSVSWCSLDHRLRRPKKGSPCTLGFYKLGASAGPPCRLIYYQNKQEMENTMHRLTISLRVLSPASWIPLRIPRKVISNKYGYNTYVCRREGRYLKVSTLSLALSYI